jgi:acetylornithine/succinyldiaminopimelate/putrescine aminotransferase/predicted amino acid dehydrogenase
VKPGTPLSLSSFATAADLPPAWERLRRQEQVALDPRVLGAFEAAGVPGVATEYLLLADAVGALAGAAMHRVEIRLDRQRLAWLETMVRQATEAGRCDLLRFRAIMCGLNLSQGRDDVVSGAAPPTEAAVAALAEWAEARAAAENLDGVLFGHLHTDRRAPFEALRQRGYVALPSLGYASLPVTWRDLDQYLEQLRAGHRRQVLASLARLREAGLAVCPELDLRGHADEFMPLYAAVVERAEQRIETLNAAFFRQLAEACPQEAGLVGIRQAGRLVAGAVTMRAGTRLCCLEIGLDYDVQSQSDLYVNLLLALVDRAGRTGAARLDLGQTALAAKANLGARIDPTWLYVKARSPIVQATLRVERSDLRPPAMPRRRVFRAQTAPRPAPAPAGMARLAAAGGDWARHVNPDLATFLGLLGMDRVYVRGEGHRLWDSDGREVFDLAAGYGALPFGHNPPWLWEEVTRLAGNRRAHFVQGSLAPEAGELAALLCEHAPDGIRYCVFANSGAEAVEVALKAARAATGRQEIVVARGGFHGKTLGALSATADAWYQAPFGAPAPGFVRVDYGDAQDLERALEERRGRIAAFLVEPIQGEAGVIVPSPGYLRAAAEICARHDVLFMVDEVQTGLGRLGTLFACAEEGVRPDAILLAKALGGGLVPAAACLLSERAWSEKLAMRHSSTFAGGTLAATVGLAVVQRLLADDGRLLAEIRLAGAAWQGRLRVIAGAGRAIAEVRGRGLLYGLEIGPLDHVDSPTLRSLSRDGKLIPLLCGYLLNVHGLRVMPPLARKTALRLVPPLDAPAELLDRTAGALADLCRRIDSGDLRGLTRYLLGQGVPKPFVPATDRPAPGRAQEPPGPPAGTFAFITTALDWQSYRELEPSLAEASDREVADSERIIRDTAEIVQLSEVVLRSHTGAYCRGWFLGLPFTSRELLALPPEEALRWVKKGVRTARKLGAGIVGLGALTSVVSQGGAALLDEGVGITTGNSYTVAAAMESLALAARKLGIDPGREACAVIGATGSIGRACASLCADLCGVVILVGHQNGRAMPERLAKLARDIERGSDREPRVRWTTDIAEALEQARLVVCATSSPDPVIRPEWLRPGMIICDIARPSDLPPGIAAERDDLLVLDGGVVSLPERVELGWNFGFEPGTAFACMAETISLAFDSWRDHYGIGPRGVLATYEEAAERALRHGFRVTGIRTLGRPLSDPQIEDMRQKMHRDEAS